MDVVGTLRRTIALVEREDRKARARMLAEHAGAEAVYVLIEDPGLGALVPAPGFPSTLPGGRVWRELLSACTSPGIWRGRLPPGAGQPPQAAIACSDGRTVLVFVGDRTDEAVVEQARTVLSAVGSGLRAEQEIAIAGGALRVAQENARNAEELTRALDLTRTELESKARSLEEARQRAEEAVRAKDQFLAILGHELRNPLAPIATALELMRIEGTATRHQEVMERHVEHLLRLVDDMLDMSRIVRGELELRKQPIELSEVARRAMEMAGPLFERKRQTLRVSVLSKGLLVDADPHRMTQILVNLLTNASRYSGDDSAITVVAERDGDRVRLRVTDEGVGIEPAMLDKIFEAFTQDRSASQETLLGLGLGLSIVRHLVSLHGGSVWATSAGRGRGSEFVVELPLSAGRATGANTAEHATVRLGTAGQPERILLVDDNVDGAELLCQVLSRLGHEVRSAPDGPTALTMAREFRPTIGLLDLGLPVMDGFELAERLRAADETGSLLLVAVTGYGQREDRKRTAEAGFALHLVKPVRTKALRQALTDLVQERRRLAGDDA